MRTILQALSTWERWALALSTGLGLGFTLLGQLGCIAVVPMLLGAVACASLLLSGLSFQTGILGFFVSVGRQLVVGAFAVLLFMGCRRVSFAAADEVQLYLAKKRLPVALAQAVSECRDGSWLVRGSNAGNYVIDCGPPPRVAFSRGGGLLDNWSAIVFDESEAVAVARWDRPSPLPLGPRPAHELFGGDIVSCRRLEPHFFACVFT